MAVPIGMVINIISRIFATMELSYFVRPMSLACRIPLAMNAGFIISGTRIGPIETTLDFLDKVNLVPHGFQPPIVKILAGSQP